MAVKKSNIEIKWDLSLEIYKKQKNCEKPNDNLLWGLQLSGEVYQTYLDFNLVSVSKKVNQFFQD